MLDSPTPDVLQLSKFINRFGSHHRSPSWQVFLNPPARPPETSRHMTSADHLSPGEYRIQTSFPVKGRDIPLGRLTGSSSSMGVTIPVESKVDTNGILKGLGCPSDRRRGPGEYDLDTDLTTSSRRSRHKSVPAWTIPRGSGQEAVREDQALKRAAGGQPGLYKMEAMCPLPGGSEVREGMLTTAGNAPKISFTTEARANRNGTLKGVLWTASNPELGPGTYEVHTGNKAPMSLRSGTTPAWTIPKVASPRGSSAVKLPDLPGPGSYEVPSPFDKAGARRQQAFQKLVQKEERQRRRYLELLRAGLLKKP